MKKTRIKTKVTKMLADIITPVSIYLRIRDVYPNSLLLESSDYHGNENSYSFICMKPLASFSIENGTITETYPDGDVLKTELADDKTFNKRFTTFYQSFEPEESPEVIPINGLFGYISYDALQYFQTIKLNASDTPECKIPEVLYSFYEYIIAINHFQNILYIVQNQTGSGTNDVENITTLLRSRNVSIFSFRSEGEERSNLTDDEYKKIVTHGKDHCHRGDVFQIVLSRQFSQRFKGDEFNVYRALRSVNPSPYLFYFDYGNYKIFGSSPEAHLKIKNGKAFINPIAGTFRRTGNDENDKLLAVKLSTDVKENQEHTMLVDLARNDLSRHARNVTVETYREVQFYSHVIHLVSSVSGEMNKDSSLTDMMMATFPAGTLSGAPKYKAIELIDEYENQKRGYYGGAIGYIDFNGYFNHAIMIRTILSKGNTLYYQAGAGIVAISDEESELQEVNNKIGALRKAIEMAGELK
ncbi:MAG TPA: anthranilate synthase component I family protein [Bacteroidales bacterium]|jgi:anthranilate synthase component 1|nr:anthranilate synthase component I family protein [Bacteroidales bacterium]HOU02288.1 anthranilate synthase component I family protein [Bacteroidales bacterium]HQG62750.1 anthranilate synthase component I family protein [Bacteroidales bacterium]HQK68293.1 anthranilate synthase component I family protein [Bacteroidales bacterium]